MTPDEAALVIAASRAEVQQHVFAGLLHDLNGPLNNLGLTLTLLERTLSPWPVASLADERAARARRYLSTLVQEASSLATWSRGAAATLDPYPSGAPATVADLMQEARRLLRHHATLGEVVIAVDHTHGGNTGLGDGAAARAALLSFVVAAIALAQPGATVTLKSDVHARDAIVRVTVAPVRFDASVARAFAPAALTPACATERDLLAGRLQVEALEGSATMRIDDACMTLDIALPAL